MTAAFPIALFAVLGSAPVYFEHNMVCLVPFLAIFAGVGAAWLLGLGGENLRPFAKRLRLIIVGAVVAFSVYTQVRADVAYTAEINLRDTRAISKRWIEEHLPAGARIAREAYTPPIDATKFRVTVLGFTGLARSHDLRNYDYLVASSRDFTPYLAEPRRQPELVVRYQDIFKVFPLIKSFSPEAGSTTGPSIFVYRTHTPTRSRTGSSRG